MTTQGQLFDRYWRFCQLSGANSIVLPHVSFSKHFPILLERLRDSRTVHMFGTIPKNTIFLFYVAW